MYCVRAANEARCQFRHTRRVLHFVCTVDVCVCRSGCGKYEIKQHIRETRTICLLSVCASVYVCDAKKRKLRIESNSTHMTSNEERNRLKL